MPILKTEILGSDLEINYEKNDYDKLNQLVEKFKKRLSQFPNDGRASSNLILFLAALKVEDELQIIKKQKNIESNEEKLQKNSVIEELNKEIIILKKELEKIKISKINDNTSAIDEINKLENITKLIQKKIKESVK